MKVVFILILALFAAVAVARPFSLSCTAECAAYYTCYARAAFTEKQPNCEYPSRCDCKKPFWMSDVEEVESDRTAYGLFTKMLVEHMKETKAIQNAVGSAGADQERAESDAEFSISCTANCAAYYVCKAKGAWKGDYSECSSPSGCDCTKFAWQKDEEEQSDAQILKRLLALFKKNKKNKKQQPAPVVEQPQPAPVEAPAVEPTPAPVAEPQPEETLSETEILKKILSLFKKNKKNKKQQPAQPAPVVEQPAPVETPAPAVEPAPVAEPQPEEAQSDAEFLRMLFKLFQKKKKQPAPAEKPAEQPEEQSIEVFKPIEEEEETDQALDKLRAWFSQKIAAVKKLFNKDSTQSDRLLPARCYCIKAPCNCYRYSEQADQFLSNLKKWFDGKIAAIKQAVSQNASQSDLSIAKPFKGPFRRPKCMCIRAPCHCDKWMQQQDGALNKILKQISKDGKFPTKKLVEGLKSKKLFRRNIAKKNLKEDN